MAMLKGGEKGVRQRQRKFVLEYCRNGFRATPAALKAGYSPASAGSRGWALLRDPEIQASINRIIGPQLSRGEMQARETIARISRVARSEVRQVFDGNGNVLNPNDMDDDAAACVAGIEVEEKGNGTVIRKVKIRDPMPALNALARYHRLIDGPREDEAIDAQSRELGAQERIEASRRLAFALVNAGEEIEYVEVSE
jgi:phage terminase small subunit